MVIGWRYLLCIIYEFYIIFIQLLENVFHFSKKKIWTVSYKTVTLDAYDFGWLMLL